MSTPHPTLIPGLRSTSEMTGGLVYFGRMLDKIRLHAQGLLPEEWVKALGDSYPTTFAARCCRFLAIAYADRVPHRGIPVDVGAAGDM